MSFKVGDLVEVVKEPFGQALKLGERHTVMALDAIGKPILEGDRITTVGWQTNLFKLILGAPKSTAEDPVNHPSHYTSHPSGVECIDVTRHMTFNAGNVVKYLWRSGLKVDAPALQDLRKAAFYLNDEIKRVEAEQ